MAHSFSLGFSEFIPNTYLNDVQEILFFNPKQNQYRKKIKLAIEQFGKPLIIENNGLITVRLNRFQNQQTLFVLEKNNSNRLLAIIIYKKNNVTIEIIHVAFSPACTKLNENSECTIFELTFRQFFTMISNFKNILYLNFMYKNIKIKYSKLTKLI